jgi:hypothetical protein
MNSLQRTLVPKLHLTQKNSLRNVIKHLVASRMTTHSKQRSMIFCLSALLMDPPVFLSIQAPSYPQQHAIWLLLLQSMALRIATVQCSVDLMQPLRENFWPIWQAALSK